MQKYVRSHLLRFYIQIIINNKISITGGDIMKKISNTIENYEPISRDIKFLPKSLIRLTILKKLYESPMNMKEINQKTNINYSAISNTIHMLELSGHVYRNKNNYMLSNSMRIYVGNILKLAELTILLDEISEITQNHIVNSLPLESVYELYKLNSIDLVESDGLSVYKTYDIIEKAIMKSNHVNAILPFSYGEINDSFNKILKKDKKIHIISPLEIKDNLFRSLNISDDNLEINFFDFKEDDYLLLISTDKKMMLGFFKDDGAYDQNRLLTSTDDNCIKWANELFENFKKENIKMSI